MKMFSMFEEVVVDTYYSTMYQVRSNLMTFVNVLNIVFPFAMVCVGMMAYASRGSYGIGGEFLMPVIFGTLIYVLRKVANKTGHGNTVPIPAERFTEVDEYGEVSVPMDRIQELILYTADLEDWIERSGLK